MHSRSLCGPADGRGAKTPVSLSSIQCLGALMRFKCFLGPRAILNCTHRPNTAISHPPHAKKGPNRTQTEHKEGEGELCGVYTHVSIQEQDRPLRHTVTWQKWLPSGALLVAAAWWPQRRVAGGSTPTRRLCARRKTFRLRGEMRRWQHPRSDSGGQLESIPNFPCPPASCLLQP